MQSARQARFTSLPQIVKMEATLKAYIYEAIEVERAGLKVKYKKTKDYKLPEEFQTKLDKMPALENCFSRIDAMTAKRIHILFLPAQTI